MKLNIITEIEKINKSNWHDFVSKHPNGNIFQTPEMYEVYCKVDDYRPIIIAAVTNEGVIHGILSAVIMKEHSGPLGILSSRTIVMGGPIILNNDKVIGKELLNNLNILIKTKSIYTQFRNLFDISFIDEEFSVEGFVYEDHLDILNSVTISKDEIKSRLKKSAKKNYNKSKNKGVYFKEISDSDNINASYKLIKETYQRVKLPYPDLKFFESLFEVLYFKGYIKYFGAFIENELIGVRVELTYNNIIYDYYAGSSEKHKNKYPNDFLPLEILLWGNENQYKIFDFGGAGKPNIPYGVRDYKLKFGGDLVNYGRYERINNQMFYKLGKLAMKLWKIIR